MNVLDLFSGIGGFSLGLERAGMRTVAFCEIDPFCRRVLAKHWPLVPCYPDIRELSGDRIRADGISVDVICGGFPCQDISIAGTGLGLEGSRSGLWGQYARIISEVRPAFAVVENVSNLLAGPSDRPGEWFGVVLGDLAALGYDAEWHCIPAAAAGAPHLRERIWVVAYPGGDGHGTDNRSEENPSQARRDQSEKNKRERLRSVSGRSGALVPNADNAGREQQWWGISVREKLAAAECAHWWSSEPAVGRVANGVPDRVDRLHALGNAVVPQIPEIIGRAIMRATAFAPAERGPAA